MSSPWTPVAPGGLQWYPAAEQTVVATLILAYLNKMMVTTYIHLPITICGHSYYTGCVQADKNFDFLVKQKRNCI